MKKYLDNSIIQNRNDLVRELLSNLKSLSTDELKQFISVTKDIKKPRKPVPTPRTKKLSRRPIPTPRKSVKQIVNEYENITKPIPTPMVRTKIEQIDKALKGYTKSYELNVKNNKDALVQLQNTRTALTHHVENVLKSMKGLKFVETVKITFTKISNNGILYKTAYFNSPAQTITNNEEINGALQLSQQDILNKIANWISDGSGWTIQSVGNHYLNVVIYKPMKGSSHIILPKELKQFQGINQSEE